MMKPEDLIYPIPKHVYTLDGEGIRLRYGYGWEVRIAQELNTSELAGTALSMLKDSFEALFGQQEGKIPAIIVELKPGEAPREVEKNIDQSYMIEIRDGKAVLTGFGERGLLYAAVSFRQLLKMENNVVVIPAVKILDWPDLALRGQKSECTSGANLMELEDWKAQFDYFMGLKLNFAPVALYGCWSVRYDGRVTESLFIPVKGHPELKTPVRIKYFSPKENRWIVEERLPPMFEQDFFKEIVRYAKSRGITAYPMFNSYGHNTLIPSMIPEVSAKEEDGSPSMVGFCTSNPKTYELLFSIFDQIIDEYMAPFGVDHINLGLDEVRAEPGLNADDVKRIRSPWCQCPECSKKDKRQIFLDHALKMIKYVKSKGVNNIHIANDMLITKPDALPGHAIGNLCNEFSDILEREGLAENVVVTWWDYHGLAYNMSQKDTCPELKFRGITAPWNGFYHSLPIIHPLWNNHTMIEMAVRDGREGSVSYASWDKSFDRTQNLFAEYCWSFEKAGEIDEVVGRYITRNYNTQFDKARRAFRLMDQIMEERKRIFEDPDLVVVSNYHIMHVILSYQFVSRVAVDKPYPRIYPGEPLETVCEYRKDYERAISAIASMAFEAMTLFEDIGRDTRCDTEMALRFAYECNHYLCLAREYLTLFEMLDISKSNTPDHKRILCLAKDRKQERIDLMLRLETTKDFYNIPTAMRIHSIHMQYFADLENYLEHTPKDRLDLDFFDMRHIASDEFKMLR